MTQNTINIPYEEPSETTTEKATETTTEETTREPIDETTTPVPDSTSTFKISSILLAVASAIYFVY